MKALKFDTWQTFKLPQFLNKKKYKDKLMYHDQQCKKKREYVHFRDFSMMDEQTANV
jgi:hypothetical protein